MPTPSDIAPQSADPDGLHVVVDAAGGVAWRICSRGTCIEDRCGARLMARYRDLLISQGMPAPTSKPRFPIT